MNNLIEKSIYFYCSDCRWYIPESKVLTAVHIRAMCPKCFNIHLLRREKVDGKFKRLL